jgi:hypothetical protein
MSKGTIKLVLAIVALAAVAAAAAVALAGRGGGASTPRRSVSKTHIDVENLGSAVGVSSDPAGRVKFLRDAVLALAAADAISVPRAQRALREIRETGTLGRSVHAVPMKVHSLASLPPQAHVPAEVARFVATSES